MSSLGQYAVRPMDPVGVCFQKGNKLHSRWWWLLFLCFFVMMIDDNDDILENLLVSSQQQFQQLQQKYYKIHNSDPGIGSFNNAYAPWPWLKGNMWGCWFKTPKLWGSHFAMQRKLSSIVCLSFALAPTKQRSLHRKTWQFKKNWRWSPWFSTKKVEVEGSNATMWITMNLMCWQFDSWAHLPFISTNARRPIVSRTSGNLSVQCLRGVTQNWTHGFWLAK